jgi:hypothetical protein
MHTYIRGRIYMNMYEYIYIHSFLHISHQIAPCKTPPSHACNTCSTGGSRSTALAHLQWWMSAEKASKKKEIMQKLEHLGIGNVWEG